MSAATKYRVRVTQNATEEPMLQISVWTAKDRALGTETKGRTR